MEKSKRRKRSRLVDAAYAFVGLFTLWVSFEVFRFIFVTCPVITAVVVLTALVYLYNNEHRR